MIKVDFFFILLGLFIGFLIVYITSPKPKVIIKYPTIDNIQNTTYVDENGICYKYYAKEVPCPIENNISNVSNKTNKKINNKIDIDANNELNNE